MNLGKKLEFYEVHNFSKIGIEARGFMPALTLDQICTSIKLRASMANSNDANKPARKSRKVRIVALVFSPLGSSITQTEILPRFSDIHTRSEGHIDFYFAGFDRKTSKAWKDSRLTDKKPAGITTFEDNDEIEWSFSDIAFHNLRKEVMKRTELRWKYSGDSDIILLNVSKSDAGEWSMKFDEIICLSLWHALRDKAIDTVPMFFEDLIRYAETTNFSNVWRWSDHKGVHQSAQIFAESILEILPPLKRLWDEGKHFSVKLA